MFNNRNNDQKIDAPFIQHFQKSFPGIVSRRGDAEESLNQTPTGQISPNKLHMQGDMKLNDNSHATHDLRYAPSFVDPNSLSFLNPLTQHQGYYTPNSGELGAVFHNQAGDLHTPNMGMNMMTPLSLPQQIGGATMAANGSAMGLDQFNQQYFPHFHNPNPFSHQAPFVPSAYVHRDSGYDAMDESVDEMSVNEVDVQANQPSQIVPQADSLDLPSPGEKFRYQVMLRAPTAMIKDQHEIPVSYLNKGQAYSLSVSDSNPPPPSNGKPVRYRTFVRVSFQDKEQRAKPSICWQLWKEGRGSNEAHQRGGKLQAVEYVDPCQGGIEDQKNRQVQLECSSFDGFCVNWTANPNTGAPDCAISVRFNFLSTDFSHSKGVKGIPVRLCTKTEMISDDAQQGSDNEPEVCFCKVKLFRDHGAERKLSNDVAHVKKSIEKLRQQISQAEMGAGNYGKRKRGGGDARPTKITKHKRTWSMGSQDGPDRMSMEDDLHVKLALMQEMFTSTRPVSILALRGDDQDDPDLFPVRLPEARDFVKKENNNFALRFNVDGTGSPTGSSVSLNSPGHTNFQQSSSAYDSGYPASAETSADYSRPGSEISGDKSASNFPRKINRVSASDPNISLGVIEAVDIDPAYRAPLERPPKPIACFYVRFPGKDQQQEDYYRAVYLTERTVRDLMDKISMKQSLDPKRIVRVLLVKQNGLRIMVDDDVVRELPDGQDLIVEISEAAMFNGATPPSTDPLSPAVEVKLSY